MYNYELILSGQEQHVLSLSVSVRCYPVLSLTHMCTVIDKFFLVQSSSSLQSMYMYYVQSIVIIIV